MWKSVLTSRPRLTCRRSPRYCLLWPRCGSWEAVRVVDVGEEVGTVINEGAQIELKALDQALGHLFFKFQDVIGCDPIHVVPKVLCGQGSRVGGKQTGQSGLAVPVSEPQFGAGGHGTINGGQQQVLPSGQSLPAFAGQDGIQQGNQV